MLVVVRICVSVFVVLGDVGCNMYILLCQSCCGGAIGNFVMMSGAIGNLL